MGNGETELVQVGAVTMTRAERDRLVAHVLDIQRRLDALKVLQDAHSAAIAETAASIAATTAQMHTFDERFRTRPAGHM